MAKATAKPNAGQRPKRATLKNAQPKRPNRSLKVATVAAALRATGGIQSLAADKLQCARSTLCTFIKKNPELKAVIQDVADSLVDRTEAKLLGQIDRDEFPAIKFYLEQKGGRNGYGKKLELSGPNGGPIEVQYDLSNLSDEELVKLREIRSKLGGEFQ